MAFSFDLGVFLAIMGYLFWAVTNFFDKFLLTDTLKDESTFAFFANIIIFALAIPPGLYTGINVERYPLLLAAIGGSLFYVGLHLYLLALSRSRVSLVIPLTSTAGIYSLIASSLVFDEKPGLWEFAGVGSLIIGGILFSHKDLDLKRSRVAIFYVLLSSVLLGISYSVQSEAYKHAEFWSVFLLTRVFAFFVSLLFIIGRFSMSSMKISVQNVEIKEFVIFVGNQTLGFTGLVLLSMALLHSPAMIITSLASIQYVAVIILAYAMSSLGMSTFEGERAAVDDVYTLCGLLFIILGTSMLGLRE